MSTKRLLVGAFDVLHVGHLAQIDQASSVDCELSVAVLTDAAMVGVLGKQPFLPEHERLELVNEIRKVCATSMFGPDTFWQLPKHDELFVDARVLNALIEHGVNMPNARPVLTDRVPSNGSLAAATSAA